VTSIICVENRREKRLLPPINPMSNQRACSSRLTPLATTPRSGDRVGSHMTQSDLRFIQSVESPRRQAVRGSLFPFGTSTCGWELATASRCRGQPFRFLVRLTPVILHWEATFCSQLPRRPIGRQAYGAYPAWVNLKSTLNKLHVVKSRRFLSAPPKCIITGPRVCLE
jgi:hypothetical protein